MQRVLHLHLHTLGQGSLGAARQNELRKRLATFLGTVDSAVQLAELASDASGVQLLASVRPSGDGPAAAAMAATVDATALNKLEVALATALTSHPTSSVEFEYVQIPPPAPPSSSPPDGASDVAPPAARLSGSEAAVSDGQDDEQSQGYLLGVLTVGLPVLICSLVLVLVVSRYVRRMREPGAGDAVVVEAVEMQAGVATTMAMPLALPLQAPTALAGSGSVIDATTVEATVAASPSLPLPQKMAAPTVGYV